MAGELTKGLNVLLHPKFTEICQRLDRLESLHKDLAAVVALKEERQEVDHLRDHISNQIKHVDSIIAMNKDKMLSLDELRNREIRSLAKSLEQKATLANLSHVTEQVQALNHGLTTKVDSSKVEQLGKSLHSLSEDVAMKTPSSRADQLAKELQALHDQLMKKVDSSTTDRLNERIRGLADEVSMRAEANKVVELSRKLDSLAEATAQKAEIATVEELARKHQVLGEDVAQRAEQRKTDHLDRKMAQLTDELALKAEHSVAEQTIRQMHTLGEAIAQKVETGAHASLQDQVNKVREDVMTLKAESSKLDEHQRQLEALHSSMSANTSRVKHLSLMYANAGKEKGGGDKDATGATVPISPSGTPTQEPKSRTSEKLPSLSGSGAQKGMVSLPAMAHPPQSAR